MRNKNNYCNKLLLLLFLELVSANVSSHAAKVIRPGEIWPDNNQKHIQAHGGGIIKIKKTYYWYGEERSQGRDSNFQYVSCYTSRDLINWVSRGIVFQQSDPEDLGKGWVMERPKVFYNKKAKKYVMYVHLDNSEYKVAKVGTAVSTTPFGPFKFIRSFRPLGHESRDIGQFIDDDGTAYLVFEDRPFGYRIAKLSADYMDVEKEMSLIKEHMEGGAIVNYQGLYYSIGSGLNGWEPTPNKYATAPTLSGPWSEFKDIAPPESRTYNSQSTMLIKVVGTKATTVIFMADKWKPDTQWDSRYLWMPLEIGSGKLRVPEPRPWSLNIKTGEWKYIQ
jgi:Glycosyl hydrolases family 43